MIKIGIIGTGFGRFVHIPGFNAIDNVNVVGIASKHFEHAKIAKKKYGLIYAFRDWKALIQCPDVNVVSIATPPDVHEEIVLEVISKGKAIFSEKPLCMNARQAKNVLIAAEKQGIIHGVDFEFREIPSFRLLKKMLETKRAGKLRHINIDWIINSWTDPAKPWTWRADKSKGGGLLATLGTHVFDYIRWLFGPIRSIYANLTTQIPFRKDYKGVRRIVETEDCCNMILTLESEIPVNISLSNIAPFGCGHQISIFGENKSIFIKSGSSTDYTKGFKMWEADYSGDELQEVPIPERFMFNHEHKDGRLSPFIITAQKFINAISGECDSDYPTFYDGFESRICMDLAYLSNELDKCVDRDDLLHEKA